jgi:hypothetical protein
MTTAPTSAHTPAEAPGCFAIARCLSVTLEYAKAVLEPVPEGIFAHLFHPQVNHPAFCVGHLAIYPNKALGLMGRSDLVVTLPFDETVFQDGAPCVEQDGRYPGKEVLLPVFFDRYAAVVEALATFPEARLADANPMEGRMREMFPTLGCALNFLFNNHVMMHLGQVSAWRRLAGLGSAM